MNKENFINDQMQLSPLNYDPKVTSQLHLAREITLCDATIREGAQGSIIGFTTDEKMEIIKKSAGAGIKFFQIGVAQPPQIPEVKDILNRIKDANLELETEVLGGAQPSLDDSWKAQLDTNIELGVTYIDVMGLLSPYAYKMYGGLTPEQVIEHYGKQIAYLVSKGGRVSFDPMDGPRMDFDILMKAYKTAVDAGAERIRILDSVGTCSPAAWRYLVSTVRKEFKDVKLGVHCHNDYGQAMANIYTAIECGADFVDVCINGLGERAGNPALAEVAAGAEILYGINTGVKLNKLCDLSAFVGDIAKQPPVGNKPIVGDWAFAHGDEGHMMLNQFFPWVFEGIKAEVFGNEQPILIGGMSGLFATKAKLATFGYKDVNNDVVMKILRDIQHETTVRKTVLKDASIKRIVERYIQQ